MDTLADQFLSFLFLLFWNLLTSKTGLLVTAVVNNHPSTTVTTGTILDWGSSLAVRINNKMKTLKIFVPKAADRLLLHLRWSSPHPTTPNTLANHCHNKLHHLCRRNFVASNFFQQCTRYIMSSSSYQMRIQNPGDTQDGGPPQQQSTATSHKPVVTKNLNQNPTEVPDHNCLFLMKYIKKQHKQT